jgi:hypothetical protein
LNPGVSALAMFCAITPSRAPEWAAKARAILETSKDSNIGASPLSNFIKA